MPELNKIEIIVCGDLCPTNDTQHLFKTEDEKGLFNDIIPLFVTSDLLIGNLEFPIINNGISIDKSGPILKGDENFIEVFKKSEFDVLSLANNHIKDCGEEGVLNTIKICGENGIETLGAGKNLDKAKKPLIKEINGWKIGIMAFAEQEFNIASENEAGANYLDPYEDFEAIENLKKQVDYLIILYHGGIEYYKYPSPLLQKKCRKMIESGADLVACQHSHCIGTKEEYKTGTIVYGQGNTLFGYRKRNISWNEGLLLKVQLSTNGQKIEYIPVEAIERGIRLQESVKAKKRINEFLIDSEKMNNTTFIHESWEQFCKKSKPLYLPLLLGLGRIPIHSNRLLNNKLIQFFYPRKRLRTTLNLIRCEAHYEVISTILKNSTKK